MTCAEYPTTVVFLCSFDYLKVTNENNQAFGVYCGQKTGQVVLATGDYVVIILHSDDFTQSRGFVILFTAVPHGKHARLSERLPCFTQEIVKNICISAKLHPSVKGT